MTNRRIIEFWVGILVLGSLLALFMLVLKVSGLQSSVKSTAGYQVKAYFENIGGLKVRGRVTMAGVNVGRVMAINLDEKTFQAEVILLIANKYRFPTDTSASILTAGLIGDNYVALDPGGEETNLAKGDIIQETHSALVLERLIGQFLFNKDKT